MRFNLCNGYRMAIHSTIGGQEMTKLIYNKKSVDKAINTSKKPISKKEAKLIHSLLKGHSNNK